METQHVKRPTLNPEDMSPTKVQRSPTAYPRLLIPTTSSHEIRRERRLESRPDPITLREIAVVVGLVAIGLRVLPHPLNLLTASVLPPVYFLSRMYPSLLRPLGLLACLTWVGLPFLPAWITGDPWDFGVAKAALFFTAPGLARLVMWRDRTGRWDVLDPLVIASAPVAVPCIVVVIVRLFEVGLSPGTSAAPDLGKVS